MAYSQAFLQKVATKPEWLTPEEQSRTYATKAGWMYKDATPGAEPELLVSIPDLSAMLDLDPTTQLLDAVKSVQITFPPTGISTTRRTRRRYALNIAFHEELTNTSNATVTFTLRYNVVAASGSDGNPDPNYAAVIGGAYQTLTQDIAAGEKVGRLSFVFPDFDTTPSSFQVTLADPGVDLVDPLELTTGAFGAFKDNDNITMTGIDISDLNALPLTIVQ